jgi:predicted transposase YbfD/YdcC
MSGQDHAEAANRPDFVLHWVLDVHVRDEDCRIRFDSPGLTQKG